MLCLFISIAHPDYKRPSVSTSIYFFKSEKKAYTKLKQCKISFIADFDTSEDTRIETLTIDSSDELIDEFFEKICDPDNFYLDSYMSNPPFFWKIYEIKAGESFSF
jgi:hypothetical protein